MTMRAIAVAVRGGVAMGVGGRRARISVGGYQYIAVHVNSLFGICLRCTKAYGLGPHKDRLMSAAGESRNEPEKVGFSF